MEKDICTSAPIYAPMMAGLFAGYMASFLNIIYDAVFRTYTRFPLHELINVSTIIFVTLFILTLAGILYALLEKIFRSGAGLIYILCSAITTGLLVVAAFHTSRSTNMLLNHEFHYLLMGIILITGIAATLGIPYFVKHNNLLI